MAKIEITFTEEHIALIKSFYFQKLKPRDIAIHVEEDEIWNQFTKALPISDIPNITPENYVLLITKLVKIYGNAINKIETTDGEKNVGLDIYNIYGGSFMFEDMALILGLYDKALPESMESHLGPRFPEEIENKFIELDDFIVNNLLTIEEILHQHCDEGIKVGTYVCEDRIRLWKFKE